MEWQPIETAPKDGKPFLCADISGEVFVAKYEETGRVCYRMHDLRCPKHYRIIDAEMDGKPVRAQVAVDEPWPETYEHNWVLWTRGFDFRPAHWQPLLEPPKP